MITVLIIDDEPSQRNILADILQDAGYNTVTACDGSEGIQILQQSGIDVVLTDLKMPGKDGMAVLQAAIESDRDMQVIIMTAFGSIPNAVHAIKKGAYDYLAKPLQKEDLLRVVTHAAEKTTLLRENARLKKEIDRRFGYHNLIGRSKAMQHIYALIERIKDIDATVLISGESGTGKELAARAIHYSGRRKNGPFVALNCGAIPEHLIESELFGYEKGAFTGASRSYDGKFVQADGGTIFLDEIASMRSDLQTRLLRVLQEKRIQPLGSDRTIELDVRVLAATNDDLAKRVEEQQFRQDLYHRLNVFHIELPPLRERPADIALLARHFINRYSERYRKPLRQLSPAALKKLEHYRYPGNVRELENIIEKAIILNDGERLEAEQLPLPEEQGQTGQGGKPAPLPEMEKEMIVRAMKSSGGKLSAAAKQLGISYKTLQYRLKKYGIRKEAFK